MIMDESRYLNWHRTASKEDKKLRDRIDKLGDYFLDMLFEEHSLVGQMIECQVKMEDGRWQDEVVRLPDEIKYFSYNYFDVKVEPLEGCGGYFSKKVQLLCISKENIEKDNVILHEMIHLHEFVVNEQPLFYHDTLLWALYNDLKDKIKDVDKVISGHAHILGEQDIYCKGGLHDILFLLKSLDLDIKMGYRLGTVFGYDMERFVKDITYEI